MCARYNGFSRFLKEIYFISIVAMALFCLSFPTKEARAANPLFIVKDVQVDVTDENALAAKESAFAQAQAIAFSILKDRLLNDASSFSQEIDPSAISTLVKDYEVTNERLSAVRYIGTYTFRFDDKATERYFSQLGVAFSDVQSKPVLILPFYQTAGDTILWDRKNTWLQAWQKESMMPGLVPFEVPMGDLQDVRDIGNNQVLTYDDAKLSRMLTRYGTSEAVLAIAVPDYKNQAVQALSIYIYRTDRAGPEYVTDIQIRPGYAKDLDVLMAEGVQKVQQTLQRDWKAKTSVQTGARQVLRVKTQFHSREEWFSIQHNLSNMVGVHDVVLHSLTPHSAELDLAFKGSLDRLKIALAQADFDLTEPRITSDFGYASMEYGNQAPVIYELKYNKQR